MAQGKMPRAGTVAGAPWEAAPSAYGGVEAGRLGVLAKPLPSGAGYYQPFAVVRFEDLPEELRRQIAVASGHGAGAAVRPRDPNAAPVAAPLRGQGDACEVHVDVVLEEGLLRLRQRLPGLVSGPRDEPTDKFTGDDSSDAVKENSERHILRLINQDGKVAVCLDASRLQALADMDGGSLFQTEKAFSYAWMGHSGDEEWIRGPKDKVVANANDNSEPSNMAAATQRAAHASMGAFYDNGLPAGENAAPAIVLLLGNNHVGGPRALDCSDDHAFPRVAFADTQPLLGNGRTTEQGVYYYDVLVPPAVEALRAPRSPTYAVQVSVDPAAAGGKAGDPIAAGVKVKVKAADADAGHEHGSVSAVLGIVVASSAATALAAGTVGPATAFGLFAALVGGLSLAMASVRAM